MTMKKKYYYYCKKHREHIWRFGPFSYLTLKIRFSRWAAPLYVHKFVWSTNKAIDWYISFLCFHFEYTSYGCNVRSLDWPKEWFY
jgi:hypothetical protein